MLDLGVTETRILWVLSTGSKKGQELKDSLTKTFGMSNKTYYKAKPKLESANIILKRKEGRSSIYYISNKGKEYLPDLLQKYRERIFPDSSSLECPITLGGDASGNSGTLTIETHSSLKNNYDKFETTLRIVGDRNFQNFIANLLLDLHRKKGASKRDSNTKIEVRFKIEAHTTSEVMKLYDLIRNLEAIETEWWIQRNLLFELFFNKIRTNRKYFHLLCRVNYFCSRPESLIEAYFIGISLMIKRPGRSFKVFFPDCKPIFFKRLRISGHLNIVHFAEMKWPLLNRELRVEIMKKSKEWFTKNEKLKKSRLRYDGIFFDSLPSYEPDFRVKIGKRVHDMSADTEVKSYLNLSENTEFLNFLKKLDHSLHPNIMAWYHLRPWRSLFNVGKLGLSLPYGPHVVEVASVENQDAIITFLLTSSIILHIKQGLDIEKLYIDLFESRSYKVTDVTWFKAWTYLEELKINIPPLLLPFKRIYDLWLISDKPATNIIKSMMLKEIELVRRYSGRGVRKDYATNQILKKMNEFVNEIELK